MAGPVVLTRWGGGRGSAARLLTPSTERGARTVVAERGPRGLIARGGGCSHGDASLNGGGTVLSTSRLDAIHSFDPERREIEVSGGTQLGDVLRAVVPEGLALGAVPGTGYATVGGAIAADVHGKDHPTAGSFGCWITRITLATPARGAVELTASGDERELFWATVGGLGLTGVILRATLRLRPIPSAFVLVRTARAGSLDEALEQLAHSDGAPLRVAWIDGTARGRKLGRGAVVIAEHVERTSRSCGPTVATAPCHPDLPEQAWRPARRRPLGDLHLRRRAVAHGVNAISYQIAAHRPRLAVKALTDIWHPLDRLPAGTGLYGPRGVVHYQFAVPVGGEHVLSSVLEALTRTGCPALSVTVKRLGRSSGGLLSFPMPGWTLALDLPVGPPALGRLLDHFDELVVAAGGRVYLVKDARMRRDTVVAMYPRVEEFRRVCQAVDPAGEVVSDLARRLGLTARSTGCRP